MNDDDDCLTESMKDIGIKQYDLKYFTEDDINYLLKCHKSMIDLALKFTRLKRRCEVYDCADIANELNESLLIFTHDEWCNLIMTLDENDETIDDYRIILKEIIDKNDIDGPYLQRLYCWSNLTTQSLKYKCHYKDQYIPNDNQLTDKKPTKISKCGKLLRIDHLSGIRYCTKHSKHTK